MTEPDDSSICRTDRDRLDRVYRAAVYRVDNKIPIQIGDDNAALSEFVAEHGVRRWAVLTACNPGSVIAANGDNRRRQRALEAELADAGYDCLPAINEPGEDSIWPAEPSVFAWNLDAEAAKQVGRRFGQTAVVVSGGSTGEAQLLFCDD